MFKMFIKDFVQKYMFNIEGALLCKGEHPDNLRVYLAESKTSGLLYMFGLWNGENLPKNINIRHAFNIDSTQPDLVEIIVDELCRFCENSEY